MFFQALERLSFSKLRYYKKVHFGTFLIAMINMGQKTGSACTFKPKRAGAESKRKKCRQKKKRETPLHTLQV